MTDTVSAPAPESVHPSMPASVPASVPVSVPESAPASASAPVTAPEAAAAPARPRRTQRGGSGRNNRGRGHGDNQAGQDGEQRAARAPRQSQQAAQQARAPRQNQQAAQQARAPRTVHPVLERLFALYPKLFGAHFLPLKLGVFQELLALHPDVFEKNELKVAMGLHARSNRYLESVAAGLPRHNLQAEPVEPVAPEHVHHAIMEVFRRRQARSKEDLRPHVRAQLIGAIEASGLSREDYLLCIREQDEVTVALLDEAFAELSAQAAKRDALRKTFEASGKSVAEFADMYGMNPDEVSQALERSRASQTAQAAQAPAEANNQEAPPQADPAQSADTEALTTPADTKETREAP